MTIKPSDTSNESKIPAADFKILIGGYINVNVIDGSAFFLAGLVGMCASQPNVHPTLITANPIIKTEVIDEILDFPNVKVVDPYEAPEFQSAANPPTGNSISRAEYARVLARAHQLNDYDAIILRDTETGYELVSQYPDIAGMLSLYVTGVATSGTDPEPEIKHMLESIVSSGAKLICQTPTMAKEVEGLKVGVSIEDIFVLPPHVPRAEGDFESVYHFSDNPNRLVYTGKFFKAWNADKIFASYKAVKKSKNPSLTFEVAGDQFRPDPDDAYFVNNVRYLLLSSDGLIWHGRVPRVESRALIQRSHVGVSWRAPSLDNSTELSTKILEYGAMGRPSILNRNLVHEELLGTDYPLFANSQTEFKALLDALPEMSSEVEEAARRCYELSRNHWYPTVLPKLMNHLGNSKSVQESSLHSVPFSEATPVGLAPDLLKRPAEGKIRGMWLEVIETPHSSQSVEDIITEAIAERERISIQIEENRSQRLEKTSLSRSPQETLEVNDPSSTQQSKPPEFDTLSILTRLRLSEERNLELEAELSRLRKKINVVRSTVKRVETTRWGKYPLRFARRILKKLAT